MGSDEVPYRRIHARTIGRTDWRQEPWHMVYSVSMNAQCGSSLNEQLTYANDRRHSTQSEPTPEALPSRRANPVGQRRIAQANDDFLASPRCRRSGTHPRKEATGHKIDDRLPPYQQVTDQPCPAL